MKMIIAQLDVVMWLSYDQWDKSKSDVRTFWVVHIKRKSMLSPSFLSVFALAQMKKSEKEQAWPP